MFSIIKNAHTSIGMAVMLVLLIVLVITLSRFLGKKPFTKVSKTSALIGLIFVHFQILIGWILYFLSPFGAHNFSSEAMSGSISRFYLIEHPVGMILAAVLVTLGFKRAKKEKYTDRQKHGQILVFYAIALAIISYFIPWFVWA